MRTSSLCVVLELVLLAIACVIELNANGEGCITHDAEITEGLVHLLGSHSAAVKNYGCAGVVDTCVFKSLLGGDVIIDDVGVAAICRCNSESEHILISLL